MTSVSKCPQCISYIHDTLQHPLPLNHPHRDFIRFHKISPERWMDLTDTMEYILRTFTGHRNLALRLLRETRAVQPTPPPLGDGSAIRIFEKILSWYKFLFLQKKDKHLFLREIERVGYDLVGDGCVLTRKKEDPYQIFLEWYMNHYFQFLEELEDIHSEHLFKRMKDEVVLVEEITFLDV